MSITTKKRMQKAASIATSAATILWLSGVSMLMPAVAATYANGTLLKASGMNDVYVVDNNLKAPVRSLQVATDSGYDLNTVKTVSASALAAVPDAQLIKTATNPDVYRLEKNFKRKLASIEIFNSYSLDWNKISTVSQPVMDSFSYAPIFQHNADLFWRDANNTLHQFTNMNDFTNAGYNTRDLIPVNDMEHGSFAIGIVIAPVAPPVTPSGTGLTVSLASDTPASAAVTKNGAGITYLKFNLTAGTDGAVAVSNVTIKRVGVGSASDFENVYLYDGATRLTSGRSINSTTNEASFASLGLSIPAGSTKTLSLVTDMQQDSPYATAGDVNSFQIASSAAVTTTASISGVFPITGNSMTVSGSTGGTLTIERGADPTDPTVGQTAATVAEFKLTGATEDVSVKRVALYNGGTISRSNISNFKLYQGDTLLASASGLDSKDLVTFDLSGNAYTLPKNIARTFTVKADIGGNSKPNDTIVFYVDQISDVYATGMTYGFGVAITNSFDSSTNNSVSVQGGDITVTTAGPAQGNVAKGANDYNFLNFSVSSVSNAQIKALRIEMHQTGTDLIDTGVTATTPYITDVKIVDTDTNTVVTSSVDLNSFTDVTTDTAAGLYYSFTDVIDLTAGQTRNFKVTADLSASIETGAIYVALGKTTATSYAFSSTSIKNTDNNQYITNIVPSTPITGQNQTITAASLTVTVATSPSSQSYIKGASNVESVGFIFTAGTGADIKVTSMRLSGYVSDYSAGNLTLDETGSVSVQNMVSSITLWDGTSQLGTAESFNTSGTATFDNFSLVIPKGTSKTLVVKANTSNSVGLDTVEANVGRYAFDLPDLSADVTSVNNDTQADIDATTDLPNSATTAAGTVITLRDSGSLTASQDAGTPSSALVIAGASNLTFSKVKFTSVYEEMKITKLQVAVPTAAERVNITSVSVSGGGQAEVSKSLDSTGVANFTDLAIMVPKDGSVVVTIKANLATITGGAVSGHTPKLEVTHTNFEAVGTGTSNTLLAGTDVTGLAAQGGATAGGNDMYIKATVPTVAKASSWTPGALGNGTQTLYKFTITNTSPSGGYDVSFKKILFDISITESVAVAGETGVAVDDMRLWRTGEGAAVTNVGFYNGTSTAAANCLGTNISGDTATGTATSTTSSFIMALTNGWVAASSTGEEVIAAGESKTYEIRATVAGVGVGASSNDSISVKLSSPVTTTQTAYGLVFAATTVIDLTTVGAAAFVWSDNAAGVNHTSVPNNSATYADWTDGYLMQTLPTDSATMSQS